MKKVGIIVLVVFLVMFLPILFCGIVAPAINDMVLPKFEKEVMENFTLPENTEMIEYVSACGNSSGTGDHTELYVAVLVKSSLDGDAIREHYKDEEHFWRAWNVESAYEGTTIGMKCMNLEFNTDTGTGAGYYILEYCKSAPLSWFDIRGM